MQRIPVGITSFIQAKNKDLLYIDKSKELLYLLQHYKFVFYLDLGNLENLYY